MPIKWKCFSLFYFISFVALSQNQPIALVFFDSIGKQTPPPNLPIHIGTLLSPETLHNNATRWLDTLHEDGYLEAHLLDINTPDSAAAFLFHLGPRYTWTTINLNDLKGYQSLFAELYKKYNHKTTWTFMECREIMNNIIEALDQKGYPFAQIYIDSIRTSQGTLNGKFKLITGPVVMIDTVTWDDDIKLSPHLIFNAIQLVPGKLFSKQKLLAYSNALAEYPFLESYALPLVTYHRDKARIRLYIKEKKLNHLDALLGFLPASGSGGGLKINGTLNALFLNQFRQGESFRINFQSLQNNSQSLKIDLGIPYLLNLPFGTTASFNLYKRDSLFLDVSAEVGASWHIGSGGDFKINVGTYTSSLLKPDLEKIMATRTLPSALDIRNNYLGSNFQWRKLDVVRNPRRGIVLRGNITGAARTVVRNPAITALRDPADSLFSFSSLYSPFNKNGYSINWGVDLESYRPIGNFSTWYSAVKSGFKSASPGLKQNELFRLGGFNILRGFDEESIYAKDYLLWVNEWRLHTGEWSYIYAHSDLARLHKMLAEDFVNVTQWGIGAGIVVNTSLGLLSVSTSVGKVFPGSFDLRAVKLHIGYINYF
ncbi:MAG: hypothetical protein WBP00_07105 [Saprospiraceae bacterium]